jgi:hypothetical protein
MQCCTNGGYVCRLPICLMLLMTCHTHNFAISFSLLLANDQPCDGRNFSRMARNIICCMMKWKHNSKLHYELIKTDKKFGALLCCILLPYILTDIMFCRQHCSNTDWVYASIDRPQVYHHLLNTNSHGSTGGITIGYVLEHRGSMFESRFQEFLSLLTSRPNLLSNRNRG